MLEANAMDIGKSGRINKESSWANIAVMGSMIWNVANLLRGLFREQNIFGELRTLFYEEG